MSVYYTLLTLLIPLSTLGNPLSSIDPSRSPTSYLPIAKASLSPLRRKAGDLEPIPPIPPHPYGGLTPATATGDILNTTRCYCASQSWNFDHTYGYYYLISYYNFHHDSVYKLAMTCSSAKIIENSLPNLHNSHQPECLRVHFRHTVCSHLDDKNGTKGKFCYEFNGGTWSDYYFFNKQKRGIPISGVWRENAKRTLEICEDRCMNDVGGLHVLKGEAMDAIVNDRNGLVSSEWNDIFSWGDTDDMCETCK